MTKLSSALYMALSKKGRQSKGEGLISNFQALMTALCATVGTGNIVGVATAIAMGGPGAVFWMWVTGLFGMATKYTEAVLGIHYRKKGKNGHFSGGPMHYIEQGLGWKWLAIIFAICLSISALGLGNMLQSNSIADALETTFNISPLATGLILTLVTSLVLLGGIKRIGKVASAIVPAMILLYLLVAITILILHIEKLPMVLAMIMEDAFTGTSAAGGFAGASIKYAMQQGFSRGVFSSESGLGSAPIVAAAAKTKHPVEQALISMTQTFIDTLIVCTATAFIILVSGLWKVERLGSHGASLTADAFNTTLNLSIANVEVGGVIVAVSLVFFAFSSILGWGYYGEKGIEYLLGRKAIMPYKVLYLFITFLGAWIMYAAPNAKIAVSLSWSIAEIATACMIFPNLIALILLSPKARALTKDYFKSRRKTDKYSVKPFANS